MDVIARCAWLWRTSSWCSISVYTQVKLEDAPRFLNIPTSECPDVWIRLPRHKWTKSWENIEKSCGTSGTKLKWTTHQQDSCGKDNSTEVPLILGWERKCQIGNVCLFIENKDYSYRYTWMTLKNGWKDSRIWIQYGTNWWTIWILMNPHHFLTMYIWDVLNVNANRMKIILEQ